MAGLRAVLDEAMSGHGRVVMLAGEPGIGKTRLAQELTYHASSLGVETFWGWCQEQQGAPSYWPWVQPIRSYVQRADAELLAAQMGPGAADILEIIPEVREKLSDLELPTPVEPEQARFRLFNSIATFLTNVAQSQSLILVLDDLQWADQPSLLLLEFLARQVSDSKIMVLGIYRDIEISRSHSLSNTLAQLAGSEVFHREALEGLESDDVVHWIRNVRGSEPPPQLAQAIYRHTEGNPFFMTEVMRLLEEKREANGGLEADVPNGLEIPRNVLEVIGQRLNRLSQECQGILATAAVIGRQFDFGMLRILSQDITEVQLLELVDEALAAYLIQEVPGQGDVYRFNHALVQQTLLERLSTSRRVRLHARIGETLEALYGDQSGDHTTELAYHFAQAEAVTGPSKVVSYSFQAGERALDRYAWEDALEHFRLGLTAKGLDLNGLGPAPDQIAAELFFGLGRAQLAIGQLSQASDVMTSFTRAFDQCVSSGDVDRAVDIAVYPLPLIAGYVTGARQLLTRSLDLVPKDSLQAGRLQASYGRVMGLEEVDYETASQAFNTALDIATKNGDAHLELQTLSFACDVDGYHVKLTEALAKGLRAVELAGRVDNPRAELMARMWCLFSLATAGDLKGAAGHATAMLPLWDRLRHPQYGSRALYAVAAVAYSVGDFDAAREFSDRGLTAAPRDPRLLKSRLRLEYDLGNIEEGRAYLDQFVEVARQSAPGPNVERAFVAMAIAESMRFTGVTALVVTAAEFNTMVLDSPTSTPGVSAFARIGSSLLSAFGGNSVAAAENYVDLAESPGAGFGTLSGFPQDRVLGLLASAVGRLDDAASHFEDCLTFCRLGGFRPALAWTCHDYAEVLLRHLAGPRRMEEETRIKVMSLLDEALAISGGLGMRPLRERVVALQELAAIHLGPRPTYPGGLTQREAEVLTYLAQGKTNREIARELVLSERTVQRHISNIYAKIHVRNRAEATTFALSHLPL
ncbi:MAG: hypothetical protein BZY87_01875 [SAR202 cluster bacterium Io17-Chloro-G6]|nr:MAG: hypothetical protein BZY87_01875 [SAR202 cluster bacterium Io17-Chloro-G6]